MVSVHTSVLVHAAAAAAILFHAPTLDMLQRIMSINTMNIVPFEWLSTPTTYNPAWPFQPGMRVRTKGMHGEQYEIDLDHGTKTYTFNGLSGNTPTEILTKMALAGYISLSSARGLNWKFIWVTDDIGSVNVLGKDLRWANALYNGDTLKRSKRHIIPVNDKMSKWPFQPGMRVFTKGKGGIEYELSINHQTMTFHYNELSGSTPTEILTKMALAGYLSIGDAFQNWSHIWITNNDITTLGKHLRWNFSYANGYELAETIRHDVWPLQ